MPFTKLRLIKYVSSFTDGRVRIRHPALRRADTLQTVLGALKAMNGIQSVEGNVASGSLLILYDCATIPRERLMAVGEDWAFYLDAIHANQKPQIPTV